MSPSRLALAGTLFLAPILVGCRAAAPTHLIAVKNDTASSAHVEYAYDAGLFGGPISKYDVPAHTTRQTGATYQATTLDITVRGQTIHQPITPAGPCDEVLVELLAQGGTRVTTVPIPGACPAGTPPAPSP